MVPRRCGLVLFAAFATLRCAHGTYSLDKVTGSKACPDNSEVRCLEPGDGSETLRNKLEVRNRSKNTICTIRIGSPALDDWQHEKEDTRIVVRPNQATRVPVVSAGEWDVWLFDC